MLLSDGTIINMVEAGDLVIRPWNPERVQPASVDLTLGARFKILERSTRTYIDPEDVPEDLYREINIGDKGEFVMHPGEFALGSTIEWVELPDDVSARMEGKSSLGRLGLMIHSTAGWVDAGWKGELTLELHNVSVMPIALREGMRIGQMSFMQMDNPATRPYGSPGLGSRYQGQAGPTPARAGENRS